MTACAYFALLCSALLFLTGFCGARCSTQRHLHSHAGLILEASQSFCSRKWPPRGRMHTAPHFLFCLMHVVGWELRWRWNFGVCHGTSFCLLVVANATSCALLTRSRCQSFDPSSTKHTNKEVGQYFHREDDRQNGKDQVEDIEYSSGAAHAAVRGSSKPNFQHEFQGSGKMKPPTVPWKRVGLECRSV